MVTHSFYMLAMPINSIESFFAKTSWPAGHHAFLGKPGDPEFQKATRISTGLVPQGLCLSYDNYTEETWGMSGNQGYGRKLTKILKLVAKERIQDASLWSFYAFTMETPALYVIIMSFVVQRLDGPINHSSTRTCK